MCVMVCVRVCVCVRARARAYVVTFVYLCGCMSVFEIGASLILPVIYIFFAQRRISVQGQSLFTALVLIFVYNYVYVHLSLHISECLQRALSSLMMKYRAQKKPFLLIIINYYHY